ncbi:MAG: hypothetical protein ACRCVT_16165 [Leadbetterella sp.]
MPPRLTFCTFGFESSSSRETIDFSTFVDFALIVEGFSRFSTLDAVDTIKVELLISDSDLEP